MLRTRGQRPDRRVAVMELAGLLALGTEQSAQTVKPTEQEGNAFSYKRLKSR